MALFSECRPQCAQTVLDTADIVRDGDFSPTDSPTGKDTARRTTIVFGFQSIQSGFQAYLPRRSSQKILAEPFASLEYPFGQTDFPDETVLHQPPSDRHRRGLFSFPPLPFRLPDFQGCDIAY